MNKFIAMIKNFIDYIISKVVHIVMEKIMDEQSSVSDLVKLSATDGVANTDLLNRLLAEKDVTLETGDYPVAPGILVDGRTLDLNGSHLTSTELRFTGALIALAGESPCVKNGWLSGLYAAARTSSGSYEDGGVSYEAESAIRFKIGGFTNAIISGLKINNFCGFAIVEGGTDVLSEKYSIGHRCTVTGGGDKIYAKNGNEFIFSFDSTDRKYPYLATIGTGYTYYVSDTPGVRYTFLNDNGEIVDIQNGIPGEPVQKPDGSTKVSVHLNLDKFPKYGFVVNEIMYDNTIRIENCEIYCNQRLAIANLCGNSEVINCVSRSNGFPREDHTGIMWDSSTSGFIDIEDLQTPNLYIENCSSENENLGVASRAYNLNIIDSPNLKTSLYKGWAARIVNSGEVTFYNPDTVFEVDLTLEGTTKCNDKFVHDKKNRTGCNLLDKHIIPVLGAVYDECMYTNTTTGILWYGSDVTSIFTGCIFNLGADWMLSRGKFNFTFKNCTIKTNGHYLVKHMQNNRSYLTFENCIIDDESKLTTEKPVTVTIL